MTLELRDFLVGLVKVSERRELYFDLLANQVSYVFHAHRNVRIRLNPGPLGGPSYGTKKLCEMYALVTLEGA